ncbi:hypothetical protein ACJJTC_005696 [Scirpophaga incertulas]
MTKCGLPTASIKIVRWCVAGAGGGGIRAGAEPGPAADGRDGGDRARRGRAGARAAGAGRRAGRQAARAGRAPRRGRQPAGAPRRSFMLPSMLTDTDTDVDPTAKIKIAHLEEQQRQIEAATAALAAGGGAAAAAAALQPRFGPEHLAQCVRGTTPLQEENGLPEDGEGAPQSQRDPFLPLGAAQEATGADEFAADAFAADAFAADKFAADTFAADAFTPQDAGNASNAKDDGGAGALWEADPFAVLHAPQRPRAPPPRPAPPRPAPPTKGSRHSPAAAPLTC